MCKHNLSINVHCVQYLLILSVFIDISCEEEPLEGRARRARCARLVSRARALQRQGLKRAFVGKEATFTVETQNADTNALSVGLLGPELMSEEVSVRRASRFQYAVSYLVREKGTYHVLVKWGDDPVPDSPFVVECS